MHGSMGGGRKPAPVGQPVRRPAPPALLAPGQRDPVKFAALDAGARRVVDQRLGDPRHPRDLGHGDTGPFPDHAVHRRLVLTPWAHADAIAATPNAPAGRSCPARPARRQLVSRIGAGTLERRGCRLKALLLGHHGRQLAHPRTNRHGRRRLLADLEPLIRGCGRLRRCPRGARRGRAADVLGDGRRDARVARANAVARGCQASPSRLPLCSPLLVREREFEDGACRKQASMQQSTSLGALDTGAPPAAARRAPITPRTPREGSSTSSR
jgi:hypothetical protein